ncbi:hypothetical protein PG996_011031 [Apiospora saccharicola]|uniref:Uncharacterized protein n=1 Tax=Apiospora saccharicola TaxID=335842 RepID=A0ABR1UGU9_9PEZI
MEILAPEQNPRTERNRRSPILTNYFISDLESFDAAFPRKPRGWTHITNGAGIDPHSLAGPNTAVYDR